jgi:hypothetical protein
MPALVSLGDTEIMTAIRAVLLYLLPPGVEVIRAYSNRVAQPIGPDYCVLSEVRRERLSTNLNTDVDIKVIGSIAGDTMTVTSGPVLLPGTVLFGPAVVAGSAVTAMAEQAGTYTVAPSQTVPAGSRIYAGRHAMQQPVDIVYQCDVYGPNSNRNALAIHTTWRDERGCQLLAEASQPHGMTPLYADDPRMVGFDNAEAQWEDRWTLELHTQVNLVVTLGQEFADKLEVDLLPVDLFLIP